MSRSVLALAVLTTLAAAAPAFADVWFDIGGGQTVTIYASGAPDSWEQYPPYPFGPSPPGNLVYQNFSVAPCEALGASGPLCGPGRFVRGFKIYFYGLTCGCNGALWEPTQLRFGYDPAVVAAAGASEANLKLLFVDEESTNWSLVQGAVVDTAGNAITTSWRRDVLGWRQFAILTHDVTPVTANSWGRIKSLYRR